ncbi:MAG: AI-2E family transporter, partial [Tenericutes bacterium]|nr:AI-2E family transporter [Mycoplasmatota bacterium]
MLNKKNKELDVPRLNEIIKISNHLLKIFYPLMIAGAILLITFVLNEWKVLSFAYRILQILKPLFIGLIIAWLFDPFVTWLSNKKTNRVLSTVITFLIVATIIYIFLSFFIPVLANQTNDFISFLPNILKYLQKFVDNIFYNIESVSG